MVKQNLEFLTCSVYEKISLEKAEKILGNRKLGYSKLKFIPKDNEGNLRPIVNMKYSSYKTTSSDNQTQPKSINAILNTTFQILKYEKVS